MILKEHCAVFPALSVATYDIIVVSFIAYGGLASGGTTLILGAIFELSMADGSVQLTIAVELCLISTRISAGQELPKLGRVTSGE